MDQRELHRMQRAREQQIYNQQVAQMRQQKAIEERQVDYNQAVYGYQEALQNRQAIESEAARTTDPEERAALTDQWHYYDTEVQQCAAEIQKLNPQPSPADRAMYKYKQERLPYIQRHGQLAEDKINRAFVHAVQCGYTPGTPQFEEALDDRLEMYAHDSVVSGGPPARFDRNSDKALTRDGAAQISGYKDYASLHRELKRQGKVS